MKKIISFIIIITFIVAAAGFVLNRDTIFNKSKDLLTDSSHENVDELTDDADPLSIALLREGEYPGSDIVIESELDAGSNYKRYIASYKSEGLKIFALLTVPLGVKPKNGWPVVIFNHGYIPPSEYRTTERYIAYTDAFSRSGYILIRPDYRGHGESEGQARGGYGSNDYTIDVLNALSSIKKYKDADPAKIGMWGHSMGGFITLRNMVISKDIKAGVIWGGVVASYPDLLKRWRRTNFTPPPTSGLSRSWRITLVEKYGDPDTNPDFWNSISANSYLKDISGPVQIHHGEADASVPVEFSKTLEAQLKQVDKPVELYMYPGDDHDISANLNIALSRSVEFFNKYLK